GLGSALGRGHVQQCCRPEATDPGDVVIKSGGRRFAEKAQIGTEPGDHRDVLGDLETLSAQSSYRTDRCELVVDHDGREFLLLAESHCPFGDFLRIQRGGCDRYRLEPRPPGLQGLQPSLRRSEGWRPRDPSNAAMPCAVQVLEDLVESGSVECGYRRIWCGAARASDPGRSHCCAADPAFMEHRGSGVLDLQICEEDPVDP